MKNAVLALLSLFALAACKKEDKTEEVIADVPVETVHIKRFDKAFFEGGPEALPQLKQEYPYFFPEGNDDAVWAGMMKDTFQLALYAEVQKQYPNLNSLEQDFAGLFQHIKYYYPDFNEPQVVTLVSDDTETRAIYTPNLIVVPLTLYLGADNRHYDYEELPRYKVQEFIPERILPDVVTSFGQTKIAPPRDRSLLGLMVYYGKLLYMQDILLPDTPDNIKMGYLPEQQEWAVANEEEIWRYMVENKLLYDTDPKLAARFINPAPFSKFYLEVDNESPGRIGGWLGWQIVRAYMENNKSVTLQDMLATDAKTIFENSKYKPKK